MPHEFGKLQPHRKHLLHCLIEGLLVRQTGTTRATNAPEPPNPTAAFNGLFDILHLEAAPHVPSIRIDDAPNCAPPLRPAPPTNLNGSHHDNATPLKPLEQGCTRKELPVLGHCLGKQIAGRRTIFPSPCVWSLRHFYPTLCPEPVHRALLIAILGFLLACNGIQPHPALCRA